MPSAHILAIDQGTTNTKVLLFDEASTVVARAVSPGAQPTYSATLVARSCATARNPSAAGTDRRRTIEGAPDVIPRILISSGGLRPPDPLARSLAGAPTPRSARVAYSLPLVRAPLMR